MIIRHLCRDGEARPFNILMVIRRNLLSPAVLQSESLEGLGASQETEGSILRLSYLGTGCDMTCPMAAIRSLIPARPPVMTKSSSSNTCGHGSAV